MATACYNFFPNCSARESAFFLMFGRHPIHKLTSMLHAARRYFHDDNSLPGTVLCIENSLHYHYVSINLLFSTVKLENHEFPAVHIEDNMTKTQKYKKKTMYKLFIETLSHLCFY